MFNKIFARCLSALSFALLMCACGGGGEAPAASTAVAASALSPLAQLGQKVFSDRRLSGSGRMSCASCHDPAFAHGPANALPVQVGGAFETEFGLRAAPSLRYLERQPGFSLSAAGVPVGGLMSDGRADNLAAQARLPIFNPRELDAGDEATLARKLRAAAYAPQLAQLLRQDLTLADTASVVSLALDALQAFQREDPQLHPYDSKYDRFLAHQAHLSAAEWRGLQAFLDPARGNCAACHPATSASGKGPPLFTDFGYAATGVPRHRAIPANADPAYVDLGLCGPQRQDLSLRAELCGLFRTPSLRNVAARPVFFHNGVFTSLAQVLDFYNTRDTAPARWYPGGRRFDDLPPAYQGNLSRLAPFGARIAGSEPPMSAQDLSDIECFLHTLSDSDVVALQALPACQD